MTTKWRKLLNTEIDNLISILNENIIKTCQKCGSMLKTSKKVELLGICSWKACKAKKYAFKHPIFKSKKISCINILKIIELWLLEISNKQICYLMDVNKSTVRKILKNVGEIAIPKYKQSFKKLGGDNIVVEVDESKFGKRKYNRGHHVEGVWVFGVVERTEERRIFLTSVQNRKSNTLIQVLKDTVEKKSIIYSDCWRGYKNIKEYFYKHCEVNHSKYFVDPISKVNTNTIEGNWCAVKKNIPNRARTFKNIDLYLLKFMILRNEKLHPLIELVKYLI